MRCLDDDTVLGLVEGRLPPPVLATVDEHLDRCASCRDVVTQVARSLSPARALERGATVGRYVIGELVGEGAMGRVYSAWEPELDRRVALKLLSTTDASARDRAVREAKAMAKLDHPNVVGVHEVGASEGATFVAMELVDGETLRAYAAAPHPWRERTGLLADIARGLAAVHAAGVVHRDVKPDNIVVGHDGRARIADFGLARSGATPPASAPAFAAGSIDGTGLAGTPAYMAPEVADGGSATPASDQFSFGVTAYEVLAGTRPFAATTFAKLREAYRSRAAVAPLREVPAWLDTAIRRCLAIDPAERFASSSELAETLARGLVPRQRPRLLVAGIAAAALIASGATYLALRTPAAVATCATGASEIAATWNSARRSELARLGEPALRALDRWASAWAIEKDATCRSAATAPPTMIAARTRCLDRRRDEATALFAAAASAPVTSTLVDTLAALPGPDECAATATDPADPIPIDRAAVVDDVQHRLAALRATLALGDARPILDAAAKLVETARSSGHAPTLAEAELLHADALRATSQLDAAVVAVRSAAASAERGHADQLAARIWLARVAIAGDRRDLASADDLIAIAWGAIDRAGAPPRLVATLLKHRGLVAYNRGRLDEARTLLADAHDRLAAMTAPAELGATIERIAVESALGSVERAAGNLDAAEAWHERALAADRALRGEHHPDIARDLHNLAGVARLRGDLVLAVERYSAALAIEIATRGEASVEAGLTHNSLGLVALARATAPSPEIGQLAEARAQFTRARDIFVAASHGDRAVAEHNLGLVAAAAGDHRAAIGHFDVAAALYATTIGATAEGAKRLVVDRAASARALASRVRPPPPPVAPSPRWDVGVYGSTQSW